MSQPPRPRQPARPRERARRSHAALARQVLDAVRSQRMQAGDHLAEQTFADLCGVSRTPIRSAFRLLAENGILRRRPSDGYFLSADVEHDAAALEVQLDAIGGSLADRILADRASRRLDDLLSVSFLVRRYQTTRSAVLNALNVLQQDGLVDHVPGQSWAFRPMLDTPAAAAESLSFRLILEPAAILAPGFALDQARARIIRQATEELAAAPAGQIGAHSFRRLDTDFHDMIARGSANRFLHDTLIAHHRLRRATQKDIATPEFRLRQALQEHLGILDSLERRQFDVAADQMRLHLRLSRILRPGAANRGSPPMALHADRGPR